MRSRHAGVPLMLLAACAAPASTAPSSAPASAAGEVRAPPPPPWVRTSPPPPLASRAEPRRAEGVEVVLENQLRVVVIERHRRHIVSTRLVFGSGAAADQLGARGSTYFAVALLGDLYEETSSGDRRVGEESLRAIVGQSGGVFRFNVSADISGIGIDGYAQDANAYLDHLARAVINPRRGEMMFDARRTGLIHALEDLELNDEEVFSRFLVEAAFGVGHVYSRSIFGTLADLKDIGHEQVVEQQNRLLRPQGAVLLVVGDVKAQAVIAQARKAFKNWRPGAGIGKTRVDPPVVSINDSVVLIPRKSAHTMEVCAARPVSDVEGSDAGLDVLAAVLGRGANARLSVSLREKHGLSYFAYASIIRRRYGRALLACTRVLREDASHALGFLIEAVSELEAAPPAEGEVQRAKATLIADVETEYEGVDSAADAWVRAFEVGRDGSPAARIEALEKVSVDEVHGLAKRVLAPKKLQILLAGEPSFAKTAVRANRLGRVDVVGSVR